MEKYAKLLDKEEEEEQVVVVKEEWIKVTVVILAAVEDDHLLEPRNFRIKKSTKLINLKREYSYRVGYPPHSFRFYFGDRKIANSDTPQSIGMGEGDTVVAIRKHGCTLL